MTCPEDRVTVKERPDLDPAKEMAPEGWLDPKPPPEDVEDDPGRLAKWNADQEKQIASVRSMYSRNDMFEVSGCDRTMILGCHHPSGSKGTNMALVSCEESRRAKEQREQTEKSETGKPKKSKKKK